MGVFSVAHVLANGVRLAQDQFPELHVAAFNAFASKFARRQLDLHAGNSS